jgi:hypothetical protein
MRAQEALGSLWRARSGQEIRADMMAFEPAQCRYERWRIADQFECGSVGL